MSSLQTAKRNLPGTCGLSPFASVHILRGIEILGVSLETSAREQTRIDRSDTEERLGSVHST